MSTLGKTLDGIYPLTEQLYRPASFRRRCSCSLENTEHGQQGIQEVIGKVQVY